MLDAVGILQQLPGWKSKFIPGRSSPLFISPEGQVYRFVQLSDPFGLIPTEYQMISEDCYPAQRAGLIKLAPK